MSYRTPIPVYVEGRPILLHAATLVTHDLQERVHAFDDIRDHIARDMADDMCAHVVARHMRTYPATSIPDASEFHVAVYVIDPYEVEAGVRALLAAYPDVLEAIRSD